MTAPQDSSQPRLAPGCRWGAETKPAETKLAERNPGTERSRMVLFPEGAIKLQGTGLQILERCDGQRTFGQILAELQTQFDVTDPEKIRSDISQFLEQLRLKRIVDY
jgi:coenzyme PQQ biosynthesis protein PqqD